MKFLSIFVTPVFFLLAETAVYSPLHQKHGPLYEGVRLLIADEKFSAELLWNETVYHINETSTLLDKALSHMDKYGSTIGERLKEMNNIEPSEELRPCFKKYEREIAHFNRDLYNKHTVCMETLDNAMTHLANETAEEITFMRHASNGIQNVTDICNISALRHVNSNQAGITLCVIAQIGQINQRLMESSQFCLDIVSDISVDSGDGTNSDSCRDFYDLKQQFDTVYNEINECVNAGGKM